MIILVVVIAVLALCFGGVLIFGAPYLPTLSPQVKAALELADLKSGQTLIELGSGDGKVLIAAAEQGIKAIGYELNPLLVIISWARTRRYRSLVSVKWRNFWGTTLPESDAVFVFLLDRFMERLDHKLEDSAHKPIKLISFAFRVPGKAIDQEKHGVYLYLYD
jgi:hypothetical protein